MKLRRRETVSLQLLTALGAAALLFPFLWMIAASLQTLQEVESFPPIWIPAEPQWNNYVDAVLNYNIGRALINSAVITTVSVVGQLIVCSLGRLCLFPPALPRPRRHLHALSGHDDDPPLRDHHSAVRNGLVRRADRHLYRPHFPRAFQPVRHFSAAPVF